MKKIVIVTSAVIAAIGLWSFRPEITRAARFEGQYIAASLLGRDGVLIVGDSRVAMLNANKLCGRRMAHIGFPGYGAAEVLGAIRRRPIHSHAGTVILAVGINDAKRSASFDEKKWSGDLAAISAAMPAQPLYSAVIPASSVGKYSYTMFDPARLTKMDAAMRALGTVIRYPGMVDGWGHLRQDYSQDGTHLNEAGASAWLDGIERAACPDHVN